MRIVIALLLTIFVRANCDILDDNAYVYLLRTSGIAPILNRFDPPMIIRIATTGTVAAFDALAPFHNTSVGIYSEIARFPLEQRTIRNKNIAAIYAVYRAATALCAEFISGMNNVFKELRLDPNNETLDTTTPIGVGNYAAKMVLMARENDGMNQLGNENGKTYNRKPYEDYTNYKPKNTAHDFTNIGNWQPNIEASTQSIGVFFVQEIVYPQYGRVTPYSINVSDYSASPPLNSFSWNTKAYKSQTDEIIENSKKLDDYRKMATEHFDNKITALFDPLVYLAQKNDLPVDEVVILDTITNIALFDAGIVAWKEKLKYDTVRPFSTIRSLYGNTTFEAWGGPGMGIVKNISGREWRSYIRTAAHPEYPSGSACFCSAQYEAAKLYFGTDEFFGYSVSKTKGSSVIEPGITPANDTILGPYNKFQEYVDECANSRVWGGVHFRAAVEESKRLCKAVGTSAYRFVKNHILGLLSDDMQF